MKTEEIKNLITDYDLKLGWNPQTEAEGIRVNDIQMKRIKENPAIGNKIKENKQEIMSFMNAEKDRVKKEEQEKWEIALTEVEKAKIISITYIIGCDCANEYNIKYDIENEAICNRQHDDRKKLKLIDLSKYGQETNVEKLDATGMSYGGYKFNTKQSEELMIIANTKQQEILKEKEEKEKRITKMEEEKRKSVFSTAKVTGEKQILKTYSIECQDKNEECSTDFVTLFALPDGTTEKTCNHTW